MKGLKMVYNLQADGLPMQSLFLINYQLVQTLNHHQNSSTGIVFIFDNLQGERHLIMLRLIPIEGRPKTIG